MAGNSNSGRPRKPVAKLKLMGDFREDRHGERAAAVRPEGTPAKPEGLSDEAAWCWDFVVSQLEVLDIAKRLDTIQLWSMCELWGLYRKSVEAANLAPLDKLARTAVTGYKSQFDSLAGKFGLTPSDREKLNLKRDEGKSEFDTFMEQHA